jgi:hypothetical protein
MAHGMSAIGCNTAETTKPPKAAPSRHASGSGYFSGGVAPL